MGDEPVALADLLDQPVDLVLAGRQGHRVEARLLEFLVGVADDDRHLEVVRLVARSQVDALEVAGGFWSVGVVANLAGQALGEQILVELAKGRVLDDEQHVEVVGRLLPLRDALAGLALEFVDLVVAAPHQAKAAADRLLQQDRCLRGTQRHDDADVVDVEALAEHQDARR